MRILFLVGRELSYPRNQVLLDAFRRIADADVDVVAAHTRPRSLLANSMAVATRAASKLARQDYDLVFIGFYGHLILRALAPMIRAPLLFDAFLSTYDTLCFDRQLYAPGSLMGRLAYRLDQSTGRRASHLLLDTEQHVDYFVDTFDLPRHKFTAIPVGCSDAIYTPQPYPPPDGGDRAPLRVLSYSSYLPLHGIDVVLHAASLLRAHAESPLLHIRLVGDGPLHGQMRRLAQELRLDNVTFAPPVSQTQLAQEIAAAHICLGGHFHNSCKAGRVVPGKIYQMLAVGRPVIAADTPANRAILRAGESALMTPPASPDALADSMRHLASDAALRQRLAVNGRRQYARCCSEPIIARMLAATVDRMLQQSE